MQEVNNLGFKEEIVGNYGVEYTGRVVYDYTDNRDVNESPVAKRSIQNDGEEEAKDLTPRIESSLGDCMVEDLEYDGQDPIISPVQKVSSSKEEVPENFVSPEEFVNEIIRRAVQQYKAEENLLDDEQNEENDGAEVDVEDDGHHETSVPAEDFVNEIINEAVKLYLSERQENDEQIEKNDAEVSIEQEAEREADALPPVLTATDEELDGILPVTDANENGNTEPEVDDILPATDAKKEDDAMPEVDEPLPVIDATEEDDAKPEVDQALPATDAKEEENAMPEVDDTMPATDAQKEDDAKPEVDDTMPFTDATEADDARPEVGDTMPVTDTKEEENAMPEVDDTMPAADAKKEDDAKPEVDDTMPFTDATEADDAKPEVDDTIPFTDATEADDAKLEVDDTMPVTDTKEEENAKPEVDDTLPATVATEADDAKPEVDDTMPFTDATEADDAKPEVDDTMPATVATEGDDAKSEVDDTMPATVAMEGDDAKSEVDDTMPFTDAKEVVELPFVDVANEEGDAKPDAIKNVDEEPEVVYTLADIKDNAEGDAQPAATAIVPVSDLVTEEETEPLADISEPAMPGVGDFKAIASISSEGVHIAEPSDMMLLPNDDIGEGRDRNYPESLHGITQVQDKEAPSPFNQPVLGSDDLSYTEKVGQHGTLSEAASENEQHQLEMVSVAGPLVDTMVKDAEDGAGESTELEKTN